MNKSWRQHPTKQQLYGHFPPIMKTIKIDEPDMQDIAGEVGTNSQVMYSHGPLHTNEQRQDDQREPTYSSSVLIRDVDLKICREQWTIEKDGDKRVRDIRADGVTWWWWFGVSIWTSSVKKNDVSKFPTVETLQAILHDEPYGISRNSDHIYLGEVSSRALVITQTVWVRIWNAQCLGYDTKLHLMVWF